jgi:hypothetical protein
LWPVANILVPGESSRALTRGQLIGGIQIVPPKGNEMAKVFVARVIDRAGAPPVTSGTLPEGPKVQGAHDRSRGREHPIWIVLEGLLLIHGGRFAGSVGEVLVDPHVAKRWNWVI